MITNFYITVRGNTGREYKFDAYSDIDGNYLEIFIGDTTNRRTTSCIHITVPITKEVDEYTLATLQDLESRPACSVNNNLEPGRDGTDIMLKGALKYLIQEHPHIKTVELNDLAKKSGTNVLITPKRLLLGKPGWYQEHFGAVPYDKTAAFIEQVLPKLRKTIDVEQISRLSWGTNEDVKKISKDFYNNTSWRITKKTISKYPVTITVEYLKDQSGGSTELKQWVKNAIRRSRNRIKHLTKNN